MPRPSSPPFLPRVSKLLPICPRPLPGEGVDSWVHRIGREYGYTATQMLSAVGLLPFRSSPIRAYGNLNREQTKYWSSITRVPSSTINELTTTPSDWAVNMERTFPVCLRCWIGDHQNHGGIYTRDRWRHASRISCRKHREWLWSALKVLGRKRLDLYLRHNVVPTLKYLQQVQSEFAATASTSLTPSAAYTKAVLEMEDALVQAQVGVRPDAELWGSLGAREFLSVCSDLLSFSLTNFEAFRSLTPAESYIVDNGWLFETNWIGSGHWRARPWDGTQKVSTLPDYTDPMMRRNAMLLTHAVMAIWHPATAKFSGSLPVKKRQEQLLLRHNTQGLAWLAAKMQHWPPDYRADRWLDIGAAIS